MALANFFADILAVDDENKLPYLVEIAISNDFGSSIESDDFFKTFINGADAGKFTALGNRVAICLDVCERKLNGLPKDVNIAEGYKEKIERFYKALSHSAKIIEEVGRERAQRLEGANSTEETAITENERKLKELNEKIKVLDTKIADADKKYDNKIFTILINTVSILGIFVAIAFTGFGATSIFSNIELSADNPIIMNVFYILLLGTIIYNVLLILIYFIFKICFFHLQNNEENTEKLRYSRIFNLTAFIGIDIALTVLTIGFGIAAVVAI